MVTTTVRVVDGVHSHTTSSGPRVPLSTHSVVLPTSLEEGLVNPTTTSDDTDGSPASGRDSLLGARGQPDSGHTTLTVADDGGVVTRGSGKRSSVANLLLDVADNGTFGALADGEDVADVEGSLLTAVDERTGGETLGSEESLLSELVSVRVTEDNGSKGSTSVWNQRLFLPSFLRPLQPCFLSTFVLPLIHIFVPPIFFLSYVPNSPIQSIKQNPTHRPASWMMSLTTPLM